MKSQTPWLCPENNVTAGITDQGTEKLFGILLAVTQQLIMNPESKKRPVLPCTQPLPAHAKLCQPLSPQHRARLPGEHPHRDPPAHTRECRTEQSQQHRHRTAWGHPLQLLPMLSPEVWEHLGTPSSPSSSPGSLLHVLRVYSSIRPHGRRSIPPPPHTRQLCSDMPVSLLPHHPSAPSSIGRSETPCTCTRTASCPGLQHSTSRVSNSQDAA